MQNIPFVHLQLRSGDVGFARRGLNDMEVYSMVGKLLLPAMDEGSQLPDSLWIS